MKFQSLMLTLLLHSLFSFAQAEEVRNELYTVMDGTRVDKNTLTGFRTWRAAACDRCHGANQEGMVGPSLNESLKKLSREEFLHTVTEGRMSKGMPSFKENKVGGHADVPPIAAYTMGFFFFWSFCAIASMISIYLSHTEVPKQPPF